MTETLFETETASPQKRPAAGECLRIGIFSESFHPVQNGVTTSVLTLVGGLRERGHRVCVFAPEHEAQGKAETGVMRFPSFVTQYNREYPLAYPFLPRLALASHFKKLRLHVVHTHTPFVMGLTGANLAVSRGVPLVTTYHTFYSQYSHYVPFLPDTVMQGFLEHYLPWYYNRCTAIICPSRVTENHLRGLGIETPIAIVPTGIPLPPKHTINEAAQIAAREQIGVAADTPLLLTAGRLAKEKNIGWLLEVFSEIRRNVPDAILAVAGDGIYADELKTLAGEIGVGDSVRFLGAVPRGQMNALYASADVFCFPSPSETQGLVIGEARAAGTPCVVVNAGGASETVADGVDGFCVSPDDKQGFARRVVQLLQASERRAEMSANARRNAHQFTPERMVERVLAVYEQARQTMPAIVENADAPPIETEWDAVGHSVREQAERFGKR